MLTNCYIIRIFSFYNLNAEREKYARKEMLYFSKFNLTTEYIKCGGMFTFENNRKRRNFK